MMKYQRLLIVGLAVVSTACAGATSSEDPLALPDRFTTAFRTAIEPHRTVVGAPLARVAERVPEAYQLMGLPVAVAGNMDTLTFITPPMRISGRLYEGERNSDYIDCGRNYRGPRADFYEVEFALYTQLIPDEDGTTVVETALSGFAADRTSHTGSAPCRGTGKLERDIARVLASRAGR